jgi:hypothetical protein
MKVSEFNRVQYARDYKIKHHGFEQTQYRNFKKALDLQTNPVSDFIKINGVYNLINHLTILISEQPMGLAYLRCYTYVGISHAEWIYKKIENIAKKKSFSDFETKSVPSYISEHWRKLMKLFFDTQGGDRVTNVTDTTKERIGELLSEAQDQNLTISEQASYLTDKLDDPDFNRMRALRIARTETTTATNYGALLAADSSDYEVGKIWIPVIDANTRPDHADMDGMPAVGIDEQFEVGSSLMFYPGDLSAPAREVINCRCAIAIVPLIDLRGLPILKVA